MRMVKSTDRKSWTWGNEQRRGSTTRGMAKNATRTRAQTAHSEKNELFQ